jgi:hypothetical protein
MAGEEIDELVEAIRESRGRDIYAEEVRIGTMLDVVEFNRYELETANKKLRGAVNSTRKRPVSSARQSEFFQNFHNYVTSLYTLYKHGNRYKRKFFCTHESGTASCDDCDDRNVELLRESGVLPDWTFVQKLRVYTNHYRMPLFQSPMSYDGDRIGQRNLFQLDSHDRLVLNTDRFLRWAGETDNTEANGFVEEHDEIHVVQVCSRLHEAEQDYYGRFLSTVRERNGEALEEYDDLVETLQRRV